MKTKIDISALAPAPSKQLADTALNPTSLIKFDALASAVITSYLHGLISDKAFKRAGRKLNREIRKEITKQAA